LRTLQSIELVNYLNPFNFLWRLLALLKPTMKHEPQLISELLRLIIGHAFNNLQLPDLLTSFGELITSIQQDALEQSSEASEQKKIISIIYQHILSNIYRHAFIGRRKKRLEHMRDTQVQKNVRYALE